ncbi:MAG: nickel pincer cofactor biosynthesis protein LarC [bacterium]|nr:nickel pincer cofactor biosynthesis protein LarC [bacterium]
MKIAYLDCFSGISGDMILGALVSAGVPIESLSAELAKLNLAGFKLQSRSVTKHGIAGTKVEVIIEQEQQFNHVNDIQKLINKSKLDEKIKQTSINVFQKLADAEAKVHGVTVPQVHFHEVGALDAIVDVVGSIIGINLLGIQEVYASNLNLGTGFVKTQHGMMPIPAPATMELVKGLPVYNRGIERELVTPTGAAIITTIATRFGEMPVMEIQSIGYGAGDQDIPELPNLLRLSIGEKSEPKKSEIRDSFEEESITVIETNIDDLNPQIYGYLMEKLFSAGALDVYYTPIQMKKNRPGILLTLLTSATNVDRLTEIIFTETTTFGIRIYPAKRQTLDRESVTVQTKYGSIRVKVGKRNGKIVSASPEYQDCLLAAEKHNIPIKEVYQASVLSLKSQG